MSSGNSSGHSPSPSELPKLIPVGAGPTPDQISMHVRQQIWETVKNVAKEDVSPDQLKEDDWSNIVCKAVEGKYIRTACTNNNVEGITGNVTKAKMIELLEKKLRSRIEK